MNTLRFSIRLTVDDYYNYLLHTTFKVAHSLPFSKRLMNNVIWSIIIGLPVFLFFWATEDLHAAFIFLGLYMSINLFVLFRTKSISPLAKAFLKRKAKKFAAAPANQAYFQLTDFVVNQDGITTSREGEATLIKWDAIKYMEEARQQILLCTNEDTVFILPVDQVKPMEDFRKMLQRFLSFNAEIGHSIAL